MLSRYNKSLLQLFVTIYKHLFSLVLCYVAYERKYINQTYVSLMQEYLIDDFVAPGYSLFKDADKCLWKI
jgi:hypothetical protein